MHIQKFYSDLYKAKNQEFLVTVSFWSKITYQNYLPTNKIYAKKNYPLQNCTASLLAMAKNKSPGNDGITVEFYCKFWKILGPLLVDTLNFSFRRGKLSTSQRQGKITLIAKKGKDKKLLEAYMRSYNIQ